MKVDEFVVNWQIVFVNCHADSDPDSTTYREEKMGEG